jgi:hypothetical protein
VLGEKMTVSLIGDWMGSSYSTLGRRIDLHLFLDHDGHFERATYLEPSGESRDAGRWEIDTQSRVLTLIADKPDQWNRTKTAWKILSITDYEDSNLVLALREVILATPNLPIVLTRVHCNERAYGTNWLERQTNQST